MHILISAYSCNPNSGSEGLNGYALSVNLAKLGVQVTVLTTSWEKKGIESDAQNIDGLPVIFVYVEPPLWGKANYSGLANMYAHYCVWQYAALRMAKRLHQDARFDAVHHITWGSIQLGSSMWQLGPPFFFGPVGGGQKTPKGFEKYVQGGEVRDALRSLVGVLLSRFSPLCKPAIRNATQVFASNLPTQVLAEQLGARHLSLISDVGCDANRFLPKPPKPEKVEVVRLLWCGRIFARRGLLLLLSGLALVKRKNWHLTIVGSGPDKELTEKWLLHSPIADKVTFYGQAPKDQMPELYREHDVFAFTPLRESGGVQILEAMLSGTPVLCLDINGAQLLVSKDNGFPIPVTSPEDTMAAIVTTLDNICNDPAVLAQKGQRAALDAQQNLWPRRSEYFKRCYEAALPVL